MTIETAIENYKKEKKVMTDKINKYKSELAEQKKLLEQVDDMEAHVIGDKIGYLKKELRHLEIVFESFEDVYKKVLGNEIGIENITKIMRDYK
tara:strand:- start:47 stop:325 length:279 start_codon:yes stop_codon:yes gene_type:complete